MVELFAAHYLFSGRSSTEKPRDVALPNRRWTRKKPRAEARGFDCNPVFRRSVAAAPIEPPDQLGANCLYELLAVDAAIDGGHAAREYGQVVLAVLGVPVLRLPEQAGEPV